MLESAGAHFSQEDILQSGFKSGIIQLPRNLYSFLIYFTATKHLIVYDMSKKEATKFTSIVLTLKVIILLMLDLFTFKKLDT